MSAICFNLNQSKILSSGNGLNNVEILCRRLLYCKNQILFKSFPKRQMLDSSKLKEFANDNF